MKQARVADGTRIAYRTLGPRGAPALALLDGISCDGFIWRDLIAPLSARHRVVHLHYRGHGRSGLPRDPAACTLAHLAADVADVVDRSGVGPVTLIGHSMGVQVALEVAWRYPAHARAMVLCCGSHGRVLDTFKHTDLGLKVLPLIERAVADNYELLARTVRAVLPTGLTYMVAALSEIKGDLVTRDQFMPYLEHFARMPLDLFVRTLTDASERESWPFLPRLTLPALVVAGQDDGFTPVQVSRELADRLPHASLVTLPGTSHTAPIERPDLLLEAIESFLMGSDAATPRPPQPDLLSRLMRSQDGRE